MLRFFCDLVLTLIATSTCISFRQQNIYCTTLLTACFGFFSLIQHQEAEIEELFRTQDDLQAKYNDELREKKVKYYPMNIRL